MGQVNGAIAFYESHKEEVEQAMEARRRAEDAYTAGHPNPPEIRFGIERVEDPVKRAELNDWLTLQLRPMFAGRILPISEDIMLKWRLLLEEGRKTGYTFSQPDLIIAATALHHRLTVVTRDRSDYDKARLPVS